MSSLNRGWEGVGSTSFDIVSRGWSWIEARAHEKIKDRSCKGVQSGCEANEGLVQLEIIALYFEEEEGQVEYGSGSVVQDTKH